MWASVSCLACVPLLSDNLVPSRKQGADARSVEGAHAGFITVRTSQRSWSPGRTPWNPGTTPRTTRCRECRPARPCYRLGGSPAKHRASGSGSCHRTFRCCAALRARATSRPCCSATDSYVGCTLAPSSLRVGRCRRRPCAPRTFCPPARSSTWGWLLRHSAHADRYISAAVQEGCLQLCGGLAFAADNQQTVPAGDARACSDQGRAYCCTLFSVGGPPNKLDRSL